MNNFLEILRHLRQFAGDAKFHNIHQFLGDLGLTEDKDKRAVIGELTALKLIHADGGHKGGGIMIGYADGRVEDFGGHDWYKEYEAKITLEGLKYLQDEIKMEREGAYTIHLTGNQNQLVVGSKHVNINAVPEIEKRIDEIASKLHDINDIAKKDAYLSILNQLKQEVKNDEVSPSTFQSLLSIGSNVSSVGSLVVSLIQLLQVAG